MTLIVDGMSCKRCEKRVIEVLKELGLKKVKVNLDTKEVSFKNKKDVPIEKIHEVISDAGYQVV